jgi:hypothetical protein
VKHARKRLLQAAKLLQQYVRRLHRKSAQRTIPALLRAQLMDVGDGVRSDAKTLRSTLACPGDAT